MISNISATNATNFNVTHRQPKFFFGPLLGVFLANLLSNSVFAKFAPLGSIRLEYDPLPFLNIPGPTTAPPQQVTQKPQIIEILNDSYHTPHPEVVEIINHSPEAPTTSNEYLIHGSEGHSYYLDSPPNQPIIYKKSENTKKGLRDITEESSSSNPISQIVSFDNDNLAGVAHHSNNHGANHKTHVKRQAYRYPYNNRYVKNRYSTYFQKRKYTTPDYFEDESYEDYSRDFGVRKYYRPNNNRRRYQNGRRPVNFDDEYDDYFNDFDYDIRPVRKPQRKNQSRIKKINKKDNLDEEDSEFADDVESVSPSVKPRQRQTTTNRPTETTETTNITTGVTAFSNGTYGYGPSNGNENISITYAPPTNQKPVYGPPNAVYGVPEYNPSSLYGFSSSTFGNPGYPSLSYGTGSNSFTPIQSGSTYNTISASYGAPSTSYGAPGTTYGKPSSVYGTPSSSYGTPSNSYSSSGNAYGAPINSYGSPPSTSYGTSGGYQSYQVPYSSWYKKGSSRVELARRAQDILSYDGLFKDSFKK